jgi:uncharacterized protein (UPF0332 family)
MTMHWSEFQNTADRLAHGTTEGDWRSAISRGYYAVFHYFRDFLLSHGLNLGRAGQSHSNLYLGLLNCGFPAVALIAGRIDSLRIARSSADYDLGQPVYQVLAHRLLQEIQSVVADFQALLTTLSPVQIAAGTRQFLQTVGRIGPTP